MSPRVARRLLLLAALLVVPLPMLVFDAFVPVARYALLGAVCAGMRVAEGAGGVVWQLAALFFGHALVYALLLWLAARLVGRALHPLGGRARAAVVVLALTAAMVLALTTRPYVTPFGTSARSNLVGVLR